ncbi:YlxM family DNA-binding protein [Alicyclobacillus hesperidum]|uniref:YlxM family DNA-binding protein n=1 Tax=Alicyclobacillus hesperidum TaxID=89784 RepID=UPI001ED9182F|nr:sigma factor-like helix-turn-helix DNA-binding protein [Alicyclobacillus hesperidum]
MTQNPDSMREVTRIGDLYAFYEPLLTERQRQIVELYHFEDMSLAEIGSVLSISRQAVHDQLRRVGEQLEVYEAALHLQEIAAKQRTAWALLIDCWQAVRARLPEADRTRMQRAIEQMAATLSSLTGGEADA